MATLPAVQCPLCNEKLSADVELKSHLLTAHDPEEMAAEIVTRWEEKELDDVSE